MPHNVQDIQSGGPGDWRTPPQLGKDIVARYGINHDAFASHENALVSHYSTIDGTFVKVLTGGDSRGEGSYLEPRKISDGDGLTYSWEGLNVFLNPEYGRGFGPKVIAKCLRERNRANIIVALLMADTSTITWRKIIEPNAESITFLPRIHYWLPDGSGPGGSPNFGSALVVFKKDWIVNRKVTK